VERLISKEDGDGSMKTGLNPNEDRQKYLESPGRMW
jgi:hypothetical protein